MTDVTRINTVVNGEILPRMIKGGLVVGVKFTLNGQEYKQLVQIPKEYLMADKLPPQVTAGLLCISVAEAITRMLMTSLNETCPIPDFKDFLASSPLSPITEEEIKNLLVLNVKPDAAGLPSRE